MKKKRKIKTLKRELWKVFSAYVKKRDKNICITCGRYSKGMGNHAGHFIPSAAGGLFLRYNEDNVHAQCFNCNINLGGYGAEYVRSLEKKIGKSRIQMLYRLKNQVISEKDYPWEEKIKYYKQKLQET